LSIGATRTCTSTSSTARASRRTWRRSAVCPTSRCSACLATPCCGTASSSTWLEALGLGSLAPNFLYHNVNGGTVFLLTEDHLRDLGFTLVGDRLYFIELLTQLYDDIVAWSASLGVQLATHPVPPLRQLGLSLQPTSWSVKDVCKVLNAVGLGEYMELFVEHRVQGDVLFNLTEENLKEMGIDKVGDRLLITDIVQTLYEQVTGWQEQQVSQKQMPQVLSLPSA